MKFGCLTIRTALILSGGFVLGYLLRCLLQ